MNTTKGVIPEDQTAIGFLSDDIDPAIPLDTITIPEDDRLHAMVVGSTGSGKSTTLKLLIRQDLLRGEGVAVLDPHHDLAAWTAQRIPRWRADHLVYISPAQLLRTSKAIPINPMEGYRGAPAQAAAEFAETLLKAFDTKGVQMNQILRESATSLMAAGRGGLGLLRRIIVDQSVRDEILADVNIQDNLDFWYKVFPKMNKESITHVDNKITPITSNPAVGPFFEGDAVFDMKRLIDGGGILIFDGAGCNSDVERMLFTTFMLNLITTSATDLANSRPQGVIPRRFYLYIDEVQMLESDKLKEMLQQVRKLGIRMTLATQQLESIDNDNVASMVGNCDLYMASRCTMGTARLISPKMDMDHNTLTKIPKFHMNFHMSLPAGDIHGHLIRTRNMDNANKHWSTLDDIVDISLANYGVDVDMDKYTNNPAAEYGITPLEMAILSILYHKKDGLNIDDIHQATERFAQTKRHIAQILGHLAHTGLVQAKSGVDDTMYKLRPKCIDRYFDTAALRGRAGGHLHIDTLISLLHHYVRYGYYTKMDVGEITDPMPDIIVCEPATGPTGEPDPDRWGRRVAIEVETGPGRHPNRPGKPGQVYKNWEKSRRSSTVWFMVYTKNDSRIIETQLGELGVKPADYTCDIISYEDITSGIDIPLPPGFGVMPPLPYCEHRPSIDAILLRIIPKSGMNLVEIRGAIPTKYGDKEIAEAMDRLKSNGELEHKSEHKQSIICRVG